MNSGNNSAYRPDIDGLRAIAVLLVVIYHAFPSKIPGGFIGVDIFFVISGYLISTIILGHLDHKRFSLVDFYFRRIQRIFPALIVVLSATMAAGWFLLLTEEYKHLGKHTLGGALFVPNLLLSTEAGYFDVSAEQKPLLHLWSLGIEEQFYIFWPMLLWAAWKLRRSAFALILIAGGISFALNISGVTDKASNVFYSPHTRAWELLAGALLAQIAGSKSICASDALARLNSPIVANCASIIGGLFIAIGVVKIDPAGPFPGWWALLPVLGAALIILSGPAAWINKNILSTRVLVWFGLISFPLYLWHWPALSFARIIVGETPAAIVRISVVLASVALAWLTLKFIERPVRSNIGVARSMTLVVLLGLVGATGFTIYSANGFGDRAIAKKYSSYTESMAATQRPPGCFDTPRTYDKEGDWYCNLGDGSLAPSIFAVGDSHALAMLPALRKYAEEHDVNIIFTGASGCPAVLGVQSLRGNEQIQKFNCKKLNDRVFNYVKERGISRVFLISRWTYYTGGTMQPLDINHISGGNEVYTVEHSRSTFEYAVLRTAEKYASIGVQLYFFADNPHQERLPSDVLRKGRPLDFSINKFAVPVAEHRRNQSWVNAQLRLAEAKGATVIWVDRRLCGKSICPLSIDGKFLYSDDDHLSATGALMVYPEIVDALQPRKIASPILATNPSRF